jgi:hypothetical protein
LEINRIFLGAAFVSSLLFGEEPAFVLSREAQQGTKEALLVCDMNLGK